MMVLATGMAAKLAVGLVNGPLMKIIEAHVADQALRRKLAAEMEQQVLAHQQITGLLKLEMVVMQLLVVVGVTKNHRLMQLAQSSKMVAAS